MLFMIMTLMTIMTINDDDDNDNNYDDHDNDDYHELIVTDCCRIQLGVSGASFIFNLQCYHCRRMQLHQHKQLPARHG